MTSTGGPADFNTMQSMVAKYSSGWLPDGFLSRLPRECLHSLLSRARMDMFELDEFLIHEDATDNDVFLLLSSYVKVTARTQGVEVLLAVRRAGDIVGELAALDHRPRSASVRACGKQAVVAARIPGETFQLLISADPHAARILPAIVSEKLRTATRRRVDYAGLPPRIRVARVIHELVVLHGQRTGASVVVGIDLTQLELGSLVGVTRPTAERALRDLRTAGLVETGGRRLIVRDTAGLEAVAGLAAPPSSDGGQLR